MFCVKKNVHEERYNLIDRSKVGSFKTAYGEIKVLTKLAIHTLSDQIVQIDGATQQL